MPLARRWLALAVGLAALSCGETTIPGGDVFVIEGIVKGTVTDTAGAPVAVATVIATAQYPTGLLAITDSMRTDGAGHYQIILLVANLPDARAPLDVLVKPPAGSPLGSRDTTGLTVLLARATPPAETTHVDVVLH